MMGGNLKSKTRSDNWLLVWYRYAGELCVKSRSQQDMGVINNCGQSEKLDSDCLFDRVC